VDGAVGCAVAPAPEEVPAAALVTHGWLDGRQTIGATFEAWLDEPDAAPNALLAHPAIPLTTEPAASFAPIAATQSVALV
jgi:hypothetical protein